MHQHRTALVVLLAMLLGWTGTSVGEGGPMGPDPYGHRWGGPGRLWHRMQDWNVLEFTGTIHDVRFFEINGRQHMLVKLYPGDGSVVRVDLGPKDELKSLDLSDGQRITVWGKRAQISERQMLLAVRIRSGQRAMAVQPWLTTPGVRLQGRIIATRLAGIHGQQHVIVRLRTPSGRVAFVDLGRASALRQSWLGLGRNVQVVARPVQVRGRRVLMGTRLYVDQQQYRLHQDWPSEMAEVGLPAEAGRPVEPGRQVAAPGVYGIVYPDNDDRYPRGSLDIRYSSQPGQIIGTDTYTIEGKPHLLATVRLRTGRTMTFDLGDASVIDKDQVRSGVDVQVVIRPADVGNQQVLRAQGLYAKNRYYPFTQQEEFRPE